ncbi:MAG: hypothetical protein HQ508_08415 [Candidatus Marinimicrobia bacterium]|nr:hypothetical protein [Candidatus Neomarinimicrobiota bacterium]
MASKPSRLVNLYSELQRRRVIRVATVYLGTAFVLLEASDMIFPRLGLPDWTINAVLGLLALGLPIALLLSWFYEITPDGFDLAKVSDQVQTSSQKPLTSNIIIAVLALIIVSMLIFPTLMNHSDPDSNLQINPKSIAVLPFTSFSTGDEATHFADGITDVILTQLAKVGDLKVISRTSTIQYRNTEKSIPVIAAELGVANILEGSVQRIGDQVRIIGQLIRAKTDEHLWAETFDRAYSDVFGMQTEVARSIASALKASLTKTEEDYLEQQPTQNQAAWDLYVKSNILSGQLEDNRDSVIVLLEDAIALDPTFILAYGRLVAIYTNEYFNGFDPDGEFLERARTYLGRMAELASDSPDYHLAKGFYHYYSERDYEAAMAEFGIARISQPNNSELFWAMGLVKRRMGEWVESMEYFEQAVNLDPRSFKKSRLTAETAQLIRDWRNSRKYLEQMTMIIGPIPELVELRYFLTLSSTGSLESAEPILEELIEKYGKEEMAPAREMQAYLSRNFRSCLELVDGDVEGVPDEKREAKALYFRLDGQLDSSRHYYSLLLAKDKAAVGRDPDYWGNYLTLAVSQAGIGDIDGARKSIETLNSFKAVMSDAVTGNLIRDEMASLYIMIGEYEKALELMDETLAAPGEFCLALLLLEPVYDPLRELPEYKRMLKRYKDQLQPTIIF